MAWLYVPGLEGSNSDYTWPSEMPTGLSLAWNGKPVQPRSWSRVSRTPVFRRFLCGTALPPSTADRGVESWISSLAASRASHSVSLESEVETAILATSGPTSLASWRRASRESSSLKTFRDSSPRPLLGDQDSLTNWSRVTYSGWVTALRAASSRRRRSAPRTSGSDSSSWPTARAQQAGTLNRSGSGGPPQDLGVTAREWSTPLAHNAHGAPGAGLTANDGRHRDLVREIGNWPTPRSEDSESAGNHPGASDSLTGVTNDWQTPGTDSFRSRGGERKDGADPSQTVPTNSLLSRQAPRAAMPGARSSETTPTSRRPSLAGMSSRTRSEVEALFRLSTRERTVVLGGWKNKKLWREREGVLTTEKSRSFTRPTFRRQLNPNFVEWLMNWRPMWTSLAPLASASPATASYRPAPRSPSAPSGGNWPTPDTQNARGGSAMRAEAHGKHAMSLHHVVDGWVLARKAGS